MPSRIYCIDTSSILEWFVRTYPPTIFPGLLVRVGDLIAAGRLRAPKAVSDEIRPGDECYRWAKSQTSLFVEESISVQTIVSRLMATHHNHEKPHKGINGADPFVIAMARDGGASWIVISEEAYGSGENPKIPYVCNQEGVTCMSFLEMVLERFIQQPLSNSKGFWQRV